MALTELAFVQTQERVSWIQMNFQNLMRSIIDIKKNYDIRIKHDYK